MPRFLTLALGLALALAAAPPALAVPPANDNYLGSVGVTASQTVDTTEATTQADLFDPNRDGLVRLQAADAGWHPDRDNGRL